MPQLSEKKVKLGRNDRCWCGSGKKYKDCHLPIEQAHRAEQLRLRQAQDTLLPKIIEAAQSQPAAFPTALERFWQGKYTPDQMSELDSLEDRGAERFLTWFAFDYGLDDGQTLVSQLVQATETGGFEVDPFEARLLSTWVPVRLRPYVVVELRKGQGLTLRDMLNDQVYTVSDSGASRRLLVDELVVGHIVPCDTPADATAPTYYLVGAAAQLTNDTAEKLHEFMALHLEDLRRSQPDATWDDLIQQRSEVLNHFVMALPQEERDPSLLDKIILDTRVALQMTGASLSGLLNRGNAASSTQDDTPTPDADETDDTPTRRDDPA